MTEQAIPLEIERKWLLPDSPRILSAIIDLVEFAPHTIMQVYREEDERLVRYRSSTNTAIGGKTSYTRTIKKRLEAGIASEDEKPIDMRDFETACIAGGPMVVKERYCLGHQGRLIEIDLFKMNKERLSQVFGYSQLVLIEIELPSIDATCALPEAFGNPLEVTSDPAWNNDRIAYALAGMPYPDIMDQR